jgi:hypothetical protein
MIDDLSIGWIIGALTHWIIIEPFDHWVLDIGVVAPIRANRCSNRCSNDAMTSECIDDPMIQPMLTSSIIDLQI